MSHGFEAGCKILDNAGLDRTNQEQDNKKIETVVVIFEKLRFGSKTKQFQWKLSHNGSYTGVLLHEADLIMVCERGIVARD